MEIEQRVREPGGGKHVALDAALRTDEVRLDVRSLLHHGPGDRQPRIQMSASAAAGKEYPRHAGSRHAIETSGSVALAPYTRSRSLPIFTRIPVIASVSTRFDRPYDTNGNVSPVLGSSPITTPR